MISGVSELPLPAERPASRRATGTRNGGAGDVVEPDLVEEVDRRRVATVLTAHAEPRPGRVRRPLAAAIFTIWPTPSVSSDSNGESLKMPFSR